MVLMIPVRSHHADHVVQRIGDVDVSGGVDGDARGWFNCALTAGPPSPEYPTRELPANRDMLPLVLSLKTALPLLK